MSEDHMITRKQAIQVMESLNEQAHIDAWEEWIEADRLTDEGEEEAAEHQRNCASEIQGDFFCDHFTDLDKTTRQAIAQLALEDVDFYQNYWEPWCGLDPEAEATDDRDGVDQ
jgi:hypothetical protein